METTLSRSALLYLKLPETARQAWLKDATALRYPDTTDATAWRSFVAQAVALAQSHVPATVAETLRGFFSPAGPDAVLIENLPVDPGLPPAPTHGRRPHSESAASEAVIAGLIERHAAILSYSNEKCGAPIHEIAPVAGQEHVPSSVGRVRFACHTDVAFLAPRFCPRGLMLLGLRNHAAAPTSILPLDRILEAAPPALVRSLAKPIFLHPAPSSFGLAASITSPILWTDEAGTSRIAVQSHAVQPTNEEARAAIVQFRALLERLWPEQVVLMPGTALLFKNDRVLHGRDAFSGERWLQRAYFTGSAAPFRDKTGAAPGAFAFDARELLPAPTPA